MKKTLIFLFITILYLGLISYLTLNPFMNVNLKFLAIVVVMISLILTILYKIFTYNFDQFIFKFRKILCFIPILVILTTFLIIGINTFNLRRNNNNVQKKFEEYTTYVDLSKYQNNLIFKEDKKTDKILLLQEVEGKKSFKEYNPISYEEISKAADANYIVYKNEGYYLFVKEENTKESYILKNLEEEIFYKIDFDYRLIESSSQGIYNITKINSRSNYTEHKISGYTHLGRQITDKYNIYREFYKDYFSLHKVYNLKTQIKKLYPNYKSISYSNLYTNLVLSNNEILKIYASFDEEYNLILKEGK